jgi:hypothetical protein
MAKKVVQVFCMQGTACSKFVLMVPLTVSDPNKTQSFASSPCVISVAFLQHQAESPACSRVLMNIY